MTQQIVLTGFLGSDPRFYDTHERVVERLAFHPLAGKKVPQDVLIRSRRFARLSLGTHEGGRTRWHNLIAWNLDRGREKFGVKIASKGDRVRVTAHQEVREIPNADGGTRTVTDLVLDRVEFLRKKVRFESDTVPPLSSRIAAAAP